MSEEAYPQIVVSPVVRRHSLTLKPDDPAFAPKDPDSAESSGHIPAALGRRRGSFAGVGEARELIRARSRPAALWKGSNDQLRALLERYTVADLKLPEKVVEIDASMKALDGFQRLLDAHVLSAPIWDSETKQYTGFLDVRDLVASLLHTSNERVAGESFLTVAVDAHVGQTPSLKYLSRRNPFRPVRMDSTLTEVATLLAHHIHRVPVVGEGGRCVRIVSQSSIVQFLAEHREEMSVDVAQTVLGTQLGLHSVVTVSSSQSAREAFGVIEKSNFSGIGVVDSKGKLVGNTSAHDISLFALDRGSVSLDEGVLDYLAKIRQQKVEEKVRARAAVCSVHQNESLSRLIGLMAKTHYHRIFVVDDEGAPIGVVSVSDILAYATHGLGSSPASSGSASPAASVASPVSAPARLSRRD